MSGKSLPAYRIIFQRELLGEEILCRKNLIAGLKRAAQHPKKRVNHNETYGNDEYVDQQFIFL